MKIDISPYVLDEYQMGTLAIAPNGTIFTDSENKLIEITPDRERIVHEIEMDGKLSALRWDPKIGRLQCTYFKFYDGDDDAAIKPSIFNYDVTKQKVTYGPWLMNKRVGNMCQRGGTISLGGQLTACGFGGYYSLISNNEPSWGPFLCTWNKVLIDHREVRCRRPRGYRVKGDDWVGRNNETWTALDTIGGDTRAAGVLRSGNRMWFFARLGFGELGYYPGGLRAERFEPWTFEFDCTTWKLNKFFKSEHDVRGACWYDKKKWGYVWPYVQTL